MQLSANGEEIFFVATHNNDNMYSFELDVADVAKESFNHRSGTYAMVRGGVTCVCVLTCDVSSEEERVVCNAVKREVLLLYLISALA